MPRMTSEAVSKTSNTSASDICLSQRNRSRTLIDTRQRNKKQGRQAIAIFAMLAFFSGALLLSTNQPAEWLPASASATHGHGDGHSHNGRHGHHGHQGGIELIAHELRSKGFYRLKSSDETPSSQHGTKGRSSAGWKIIDIPNLHESHSHHLDIHSNHHNHNHNDADPHANMPSLPHEELCIPSTIHGGQAVDGMAEAVIGHLTDALTESSTGKMTWNQHARDVFVPLHPDLALAFGKCGSTRQHSYSDNGSSGSPGTEIAMNVTSADVTGSSLWKFMNDGARSSKSVAGHRHHESATRGFFVMELKSNYLHDSNANVNDEHDAHAHARAHHDHNHHHDEHASQQRSLTESASVSTTPLSTVWIVHDYNKWEAHVGEAVVNSSNRIRMKMHSISASGSSQLKLSSSPTGSGTEMGMDMGNDFCKGMFMTMSMTGFQSTLWRGQEEEKDKPHCLNYLTPGWKLKDASSFRGAVLYTFLIAILTEWFSSLQMPLRTQWRPTTPTGKKARRLVLALSYGINQWLGYLIMIIAMMFSYEMFAALVIGLMVGNVIFSKNGAHKPFDTPNQSHALSASSTSPSRQPDDALASPGQSPPEEEPLLEQSSTLRRR